MKKVVLLLGFELKTQETRELYEVIKDQFADIRSVTPRDQSEFNRMCASIGTPTLVCMDGVELSYEPTVVGCEIYQFDGAKFRLVTEHIEPPVEPVGVWSSS